jgi:hypothetical protein
VTREVLSVWVIYQNPRDYPGRVVVRRQVVRVVVPGQTADIVPDPAPVAVVDTVTEARRALPPGLVLCPRFPEDDPALVEAWI